MTEPFENLDLAKSASAQGFDRPSGPAHQGTIGGCRQAWSCCYQSPAGCTGWLGYLAVRWNCCRCCHHRQCHVRPGRTDELRDRRRPVCYLLGQQGKETLRAQRQWTESLQDLARALFRSANSSRFPSRVRYPGLSPAVLAAGKPSPSGLEKNHWPTCWHP